MIGEIHSRRVNIHPFVDGNGRSARLLIELGGVDHDIYCNGRCRFILVVKEDEQGRDMRRQMLTS